MTTSPTEYQPASNFVGFLFSRRESILNQWRVTCEADPKLPHIAILSREEFNNLIILLLETLEARLLHKIPVDDPSVIASSHGLHRWQKANTLTDLIRELNHLTDTLINELNLFRELFPDVNPNQSFQALLIIHQTMSQTVLDSVGKFDELQRLEATGRMNSLEQILEQTGELTRQRGELLRASSHDLQGGFGIIQSAAQLIHVDAISPADRLTYQEMLNRNLTNVGAMIAQLMDLARLEAGQDILQTEELDVATLLYDLVASAQSMAVERGLHLRADGPTSLIVRTDRVKIYRIVQNLVVNALKYTPSPGIVSVSWSAENEWRWVLSIQDSGHGLPGGVPELMHQQLKPTVELTSALSPEEGQPSPVHPNDAHHIPAAPIPKSPTQASGEGIGLFIVKRLCEVLGASLEIESVPERGTLFRIRQLIR